MLDEPGGGGGKGRDRVLFGGGGAEVTKLEGWREEGRAGSLHLSELYPARFSVHCTQVHTMWSLAAIASAVPFLASYPLFPTTSLPPLWHPGWEVALGINECFFFPSQFAIYFLLLQKLMYCIFA